MIGLPSAGGQLGEINVGWLGGIDRAVGRLVEAGRWLVLPVAGLIGVIMGSVVINKLVAIEV